MFLKGFITSSSPMSFLSRWYLRKYLSGWKMCVSGTNWAHWRKERLHGDSRVIFLSGCGQWVVYFEIITHVSEVITAHIWAWFTGFNLLKSCHFNRTNHSQMQFGTVSNVTVGTNSGSMGSGNSVNISRGKSTDLLVTQDSVLMCPVSLLIFTVNASAVYDQCCCLFCYSILLSFLSQFLFSLMELLFNRSWTTQLKCRLFMNLILKKVSPFVFVLRWALGRTLWAKILLFELPF